jgi:hypothetical protein
MREAGFVDVTVADKVSAEEIVPRQRGCRASTVRGSRG